MKYKAIYCGQLAAETIERAILPMIVEHRSYYGLPHGSREATNGLPAGFIKF